MRGISGAFLLFFCGQVVAQPTSHCAPPYDDVLHCPERYRPRPTSASTKDRDDIKASLEVLRAAGAVEKSANDAVEAARIVALDKNNKTPGKVEAYLEVLKSAKLETDKKNLLANQIIQKVIAAFALTPPVKDFSQDRRLGEESRKIRPWNPRYSEHERLDGVGIETSRRSCTSKGVFGKYGPGRRKAS